MSMKAFCHTMLYKYQQILPYTYLVNKKSKYKLGNQRHLPPFDIRVLLCQYDPALVISWPSAALPTTRQQAVKQNISRKVYYIITSNFLLVEKL